MIFRTITSSLVLIASLWWAGTLAVAQDAKFKAGDHVEVDTFMRGDYPGAEKMAKWQKATIVRIDNPGERLAAYVVKLDEGGSEMRIHFTDSRWIRSPQTTEPKVDENKPGGAQINQPADAKTGQGENNQAKEFKVGDRVEVDVLHIGKSSPAEKQKWEKGVVTLVDRRPGYRPMYVVQLDPLPNQLPKQETIPITPNVAERVGIRAAGGAAPKIETDKLRIDENGTVLADRETLNCRHLEEPAARNGQPLPVELAKKLVRCANGENPSPPGGQGAKTVNITQFQVGAPRKWILHKDTGMDATANTIVYPVRATFTTKEFHLDKNIVVADREETFTCHVDTGHWVCGTDQVFKQGQMKEIPVVK